MRKYVLGIVIAVIFLAYSTVLRHQHSRPVIAPTSLSQNNSTSSNSSNSSSNPTTTTTNPTPSSQYKDGTYSGSVANAYYGNVQVQAIIQNGKITTVNFLQSPNENPNSIYVNQQADPYLKQEAIQSQSSNVSLITGATFTSQAFTQSLANALSQATKN
ncbi:MAG TPA: FMN-binding protein [Candidatus Saccharimonadales bacterium]|nr:FMN-binding protein [Candidatus Saccharimonadales bacterium]